MLYAICMCPLPLAVWSMYVLLGISIILVDGISTHSLARIPESTPGPSRDVNVVAEWGLETPSLCKHSIIILGYRDSLFRYDKHASQQILQVGSRLKKKQTHKQKLFKSKSSTHYGIINNTLSTDFMNIMFRSLNEKGTIWIKFKF